MKKYKTNILSLSLILLIPIVNIAYGLLNNSKRGVHSLVTDLDKSIPYVKAFAVPYMIWYPFVLVSLIYFCFYNINVYYKVISSFIIGMIASFFIYYVFQTTVPRPMLNGNDTLTNIMRFIYNIDNPYNCFPSIHVLTCYVIIKGIREIKRENSIDKISIIAFGIVIILSTQFIKQHVIMDLIFAVVLGDGIYRSIGVICVRTSLVFIKKFPWWLVIKRKLET